MRQRAIVWIVVLEHLSTAAAAWKVLTHDRNRDLSRPDGKVKT